MDPAFITFEYDYSSAQWNLPRDAVPPQLKAQGVPHALWMHFWDYSQSVVERASVRGIMKKKLQLELMHIVDERRQEERRQEMARMDEQTQRDFDCLEKQAQRLFPNTKASVSKGVVTATNSSHNNNKTEIPKPFVLDIQLLHHSASHVPSSSNSSSHGSIDTVHLHYDTRRASWNLPRETLPAALADAGVLINDWIAIWDYGFGVNQRAKEREHLNQLHQRELHLCEKSLHYMNSTNISSVDQNTLSSHNSTANHIRSKMEKLQRAIEANADNTRKGWQELQRRASLRFEPYAVKVYLSRPDSQICCGLQFQCSGHKKVVNPYLFQHSCSPSATWLQSLTSSPKPHQFKEDEGSPVSSMWATVSTHQGHPKKVTSGSSSSAPTVSPSSVTTPPEIPNPPVGHREKENAPPKPETSRKAKQESHSINVWGQPVVLTYVHDDFPSRVDIEVSTPMSPTSSSDHDHLDDSSDVDSHGYVVPPAPSNPPSSLGSSSSCSISVPPPPKHVQVKRRVRFGGNFYHTYACPALNKDERKDLWFTQEEREACRAKTKTLAQRVIESRNNGGANNVVFVDSETQEEVCWRGLEHAKKGNLSSRQETRRSYMMKVLDKQRQLQLDSWTSRRGVVADPESDLQQYAARHSRHCRERAQRLAAGDAKDARAVYKESLRKTNLQNTSSTTPVMAASSNHGQNHRQHHHQNDIFQDYCKKMHLATKARMQQAQPVM
jgi:hypothetical protein